MRRRPAESRHRRDAIPRARRSRHRSRGRARRKTNGVDERVARERPDARRPRASVRTRARVTGRWTARWGAVTALKPNSRGRCARGLDRAGGGAPARGDAIAIMARRKVTARKSAGGARVRAQIRVGRVTAVTPGYDSEDVDADSVPGAVAAGNRFLRDIFDRSEDWTAAKGEAEQAEFIAECDATQWVGVMKHQTLHEAGLFMCVAEASWHNVCAQFRVDETNRAAYGPWRYCPAQISHEAVPYDLYWELYDEHKRKGLISQDLLEQEEMGVLDVDDYITFQAKLSCRDVASLLEEYNKTYLRLIILEFEGWKHVAEKSMPMDANVEYARAFHVAKSAHKDVPMPNLLAARGYSKDKRLQQLVKDDRCLELEDYAKEFEKVVKHIREPIDKSLYGYERLCKAVNRAVKKAVKSIIIDKWDTERKNDFLVSHFYWNVEEKEAWREFVASQPSQPKKAKKGPKKEPKKKPKKEPKKEPKKRTRTTKKLVQPKRSVNDPLKTSDFAVGMEVDVRGAKGETWQAEVTRVRQSNAKRPIEVVWLVKEGERDAYVYWDCAHRDIIELSTVLETHAPGYFPAGERTRCVACQAANTTCAKRAKT